MVDTDKQPPQSSSSSKIVAPASIGVLLLAAAIAISPLTQSSEGVKYKSYLDPVGKPTICYGHTAGVKLGLTATKAQCQTWLTQDLTIAMKGVLQYSPSLTKTTAGLNVLKGVGDFTMNAGIGAYAASPMRVQFDKGNIAAGCSLLSTYYTGGTYSNPQKGLKCVPKPGVKGKYVCQLPGLVIRRKSEAKACLTGAFQ